MRTDVHQHLWSEPFVEALAARAELPYVRRENGLAVLYMHDERPYVIDLAGEAPGARAELVRRDGLDRAIVCISSPLGIEWLPATQARPVIDAYHDGALALGEPFAVWGALPLAVPDPADVDRALDRGCLGVSLPAGALADISSLGRVQPLLERLQERGSPLLVHPGPGQARGGRVPALGDPLWWPALTGYVSGMQAAWLTLASAGRPRLPHLRVVFAMLAGLAPLHHERICARGGPVDCAADPLTFYETSSYGPAAVRALASVVGEQQILYGSDRPVVEPSAEPAGLSLDWERLAERTRVALDVAPATAVPAERQPAVPAAGARAFARAATIVGMRA